MIAHPGLPQIRTCRRVALLQMEASTGKFLFLIDATMFSQAGKKMQNTYSTGNRKRRPCFTARRRAPGRSRDGRLELSAGSLSMSILALATANDSSAPGR